MWRRRSSTSTLRPRSEAQRSATVSPKKPDPTMTRSALNTTPDRGAACSLSVRCGPHRGCGADGLGHIASLGPPTVPWRAQDDRKCDEVGLEPDQQVLAVPEVKHEEVPVHVEPLPAGQVVLLVEVELPDDAGVS